MLIPGATMIETSQNAGRPVIGGDAWGRVGVGTNPAGSGGWNVPPGNDFAVIEVTSGSAKVPKLAQVAADETVGTATTAPARNAEQPSILKRVIITSSLLLSLVCNRKAIGNWTGLISCGNLHALVQKTGQWRGKQGNM